jgi:hypothetical protein
MNCENHSRVLPLAYQILSTGLFTAAQIYSQPENPKNLNAGVPFLRLLPPAAPRKPAPPPPLVNKFFPVSPARTAAPE